MEHHLNKCGLKMKEDMVMFTNCTLGENVCCLIFYFLFPCLKLGAQHSLNNRQKQSYIYSILVKACKLYELFHAVLTNFIRGWVISKRCFCIVRPSSVHHRSSQPSMLYPRPGCVCIEQRVTLMWAGS